VREEIASRAADGGDGPGARPRSPPPLDSPGPSSCIAQTSVPNGHGVPVPRGGVLRKDLLIAAGSDGRKGGLYCVLTPLLPDGQGSDEVHVEPSERGLGVVDPVPAEIPLVRGHSAGDGIRLELLGRLLGMVDNEPGGVESLAEVN